MQTVYILSGKMGEMKNEKTKWFAGLPVWRFAMRRWWAQWEWIFEVLSLETKNKS